MTEPQKLLPQQMRESHVALSWLEKNTDVRITAVERAIIVAHESMNGRLEGMNEFRNQLRDQSARFTTRDETENRFGSMRSEIDKLVSDVRDLRVTENAVQRNTVIITGIQTDIASLRESRAELAGKASQLSVSIALFFSAAGLIMSVVHLFLKP